MPEIDRAAWPYRLHIEVWWRLEHLQGRVWDWEYRHGLLDEHDDPRPRWLCRLLLVPYRRRKAAERQALATIPLRHADGTYDPVWSAQWGLQVLSLSQRLGNRNRLPWWPFLRGNDGLTGRQRWASARRYHRTTSAGARRAAHRLAHRSHGA